MIGRNPVAHAFPACTVSLELAVLQIDSGPVRRLGGEVNLPFAGLVEICLEPPLRRDVPTEEHTVRRLITQYIRPTALAAVGAAIVDVTANARFEHRLRDR